VNLTDGIDGLAAGTSFPVCIFFVALTFLWAKADISVGIFASGLAGGLLGFLLYNFNPAKIFMGDTGSLFLGGMVCGLAFAIRMPILLLPLGIVYLCEMFSVILQVSYFKLTHGKRLFKMSPIHHHFEMCGWSEVKIVSVFSAVTVVFGILSFCLVYYGV
jgi:phospho-N-acetylmuramoyl-pentapeptide-transferase